MRAAPRDASASPSDPAPAGAHLNDVAGSAPVRLVRSADFERVLRTRPCALSTHFALHHVVARPSAPHRAASGPRRTELSTEVHTEMVRSVDDSSRTDPASVPRPDRRGVAGAWLGCVVPKRHARRAVTRTLLKRQIRSAASGAALPPGLWVVRLRAGFDRTGFRSAASEALRRLARGERDALFAHAPRPARTDPTGRTPS